MSRKNFNHVASVPLDNILLDTSNPRIRTGTNQQDCIDKVMRKQAQMLTLVKSIAEDGLGTMPILLYKDPKKKNEWVVKDGNRRITALKILNNPSLCSDITTRRKIEAIRTKNPENIPDTVDCLESSDQKAIAKEILNRHNGAQNGAGQLDWNAYLRTVFLLNSGLNGEYKRAGQYLFWAESNGIIVDDDFPISNVSRFFNEQNLGLLGFSIDNDQLIPNMNQEIVRLMATKIITDFGINKKSVREVFEPEKATEYIHSIRLAVNIEDAPIEAEALLTKQRDSSAPLSTSQPQETPPLPPKGGRPPKKPTWDRNKLFWRGSPAPSVPSTEKKIKQILFELGRIPNTQDMPLTCAMLLRALIELSVSHYQRRHAMQEQRSLAKNTESVADALLNKNNINQSLTDLIKAYTRTSKDQVDIFNIDTIQKYIHRDTHIPTHVTLHTIWDEIGPFVHACWNAK